MGGKKFDDDSFEHDYTVECEDDGDSDTPITTIPLDDEEVLFEPDPAPQHGFRSKVQLSVGRSLQDATEALLASADDGQVGDYDKRNDDVLPAREKFKTGDGQSIGVLNRALQASSEIMIQKKMDLEDLIHLAEQTLSLQERDVHSSPTFVALQKLQETLWLRYADCASDVSNGGKVDGIVSNKHLMLLEIVHIPSEENIVSALQKELAEMNPFVDEGVTHPGTPVIALSPHAPRSSEHLRGLSLMIGAVVAAVGAVGAYEVNRFDETAETPASLAALDDDRVAPGDSIASDIPLADPLPSPLGEVESLQAPFAPVYTSVVRQTAEGQDKDLRIAVANQWLVQRHEIDAHDWTHIRQALPWKEDIQALDALIGHLKSWGGYKNPLLAYEAAKARGEAPQSISAFLTLVDLDPQLANGTALRIAREIPLIKDADINFDLKRVESDHQILNGYVNDTVQAVQGEYAEGKIQRPENVEYVVPEPPRAPKISLNRVDRIAATDEMPAEERALVNMNLDFKADLSRLKEQVFGAQEGLLRWARGANRFGVQALCTNFAIRLDELTADDSVRTAEERRQALLDLHSYYFEELRLLTPGRGGYANYLRAFTAETVMPALAQAWEKLPKQEGVESVSTDTRALVFSTLPDIFATKNA